MQGFFEKVLNNLVVAAFIPSFIFCVVLLLLFKSSLSPLLLSDITAIFQELGLFVLGLSFALSLFLLYLRDNILNIYRGNGFPEKLSYFEKKSQEKERAKKKVLVEQYNNACSALMDEDYKDSETEIKISEIKDQLYAFDKNYQQIFPTSGKIYCTKFGNILSAAERKVANLYGLDPVVIWPRLIQLIPAQSVQRINDALNQLSLLVNSSLLSFVLSVFCSVIAVKFYFESGIWESNYIFTGLASLTATYLFYLLSLPVAKEYGKVYCGIFDLFRFEIFRQLCIDLPKCLSDEAVTWHKLSYLFAVGEDFGKKIPLEYNHTKK